MELKHNKRAKTSYKRLPGFVYGADDDDPVFNGGTINPIDIYPTLNILSYKPNLNVNAGLDTSNAIKPLSINDKPFSHEMTTPTTPKAGLNWSGAGNILSSAVSFAGSTMLSFGGVKSQNDILMDSGTSNGTIGGIGYTKYNNVNNSALLQELKKENTNNTLGAIGSGAALGASIGSIFPGLGTVIGGAAGAIIGGAVGLFGGNKRKEKLKRRLKAAQLRANNINKYNQSSALTTGLQLDYANEYGDTEDLLLFAKDGKDDNMTTPKNSKRNYTIYTSLGKQKGVPNSRVAGLESILDNLDSTSDAVGTVVKDGYVGQDGPLANLRDDTVVLGGQIDWRNGRTFRDQALPYTMALEKIGKKYETRSGNIEKYRGSIGKRSDELLQHEVNKLKAPIVEKLKDLADQLKLLHQTEERYAMTNYKNGKDSLPGFESGRSAWLDNAIPHALGLGASLYQYLDADRQDIYNPDIYVKNPYESRALEGLASININPYPILNELRNAQSRVDYQLNNSGGLSGPLKYLAKTANLINTQNSIANTLASAQEKNNAYKAAYYQALLETGSKQANAKQQANAFNLDYYTKAHAAKLAGKQTALANMLSQIQSYAANEYKRKTGNEMVDLYRQKIKNDKIKNKNLQQQFEPSNKKTKDKNGSSVFPNTLSLKAQDPYFNLLPINEAFSASPFLFNIRNRRNLYNPQLS